MLRLNDLLRGAGLEPEHCTVMLHSPREPRLRRLLPHLAAARPDLFDAFQSSHAGPATATLRGRSHTVAFVALEGGDCVLVGVYAQSGCTPRTLQWQENHPEISELRRDFGYDYNPVEGQAFFDLRRSAHLEDMAGRLRIAPRLGRTYVRLAEKLDAEVVAITRESSFDAPPPYWREWCPTGPEIRALSPAQQARLREWRGVYLIVDESDGARYVGAAYGAENLLGRWRDHVAGDAGLTAALRARNPARFRFSILERVSPDMPPEEVIALEHGWMLRLHSRRFGLNA